MSTLECKGLTKIYQDQRKALDNVSFSVETKGIFGLIGRNGAGKTTLIRIIATELEPTSGTASINGNDILAQTDKLRETMRNLEKADDIFHNCEKVRETTISLEKVRENAACGRLGEDQGRRIWGRVAAEQKTDISE